MEWADAMKTIPELRDSAFTTESAVCNNGVFLLTNCDKPPFMRAADGWEMVGWGKAPFSRSGDFFAVMFERTEPGCELDFNYAEVGTRLWQHARPEWVPGRPEYKQRMREP